MCFPILYYVLKKSTCLAIFTVPKCSEICLFYFLHYCTGYWFWELNLIYFQVS